ncbi:hypothetical protein [Novosphingobium sp. MMS21-SN21R]|uniref:hypothetical protein n=1 Tax=Novosphingobium sp. MMS21-SN21R TaxID=2969298 RepID=UPI002884571C|nr:hypothetical protein [Novosphingobium sp. MMS21-SN21R]MDT0507519.1 hypothetical protein [Novosphingobium sp. MMS21-SN21R]
MDYHNSPNDMARVLVQYIGSPTRVRSEVLSNLGSSPSVTEISRMRAVYERSASRRNIRDFDSSVVWMDERYANNMDRANRAFVAAIYQARAA